MLSISVTNISGFPIVVSAPGYDNIILNEGCSTLIGPVSPTSPDQSEMFDAPEISIRQMPTIAEQTEVLPPPNPIVPDEEV
jgi:hypothetical protein